MDWNLINQQSPSFLPNHFLSETMSIRKALLPRIRKELLPRIRKALLLWILGSYLEAPPTLPGPHPAKMLYVIVTLSTVNFIMAGHLFNDNMIILNVTMTHGISMTHQYTVMEPN